MYSTFRFRIMIWLTIAPCLVISANLCMAQGGSRCNAPAAEPIVYVSLPGNPFTPVLTADGCKVFVALSGGGPDSARGVAVLRRDGGALSLERTVSLKSGGAGAVLTHDSRILAVAAGGSVAFLDAARLASGGADPVLGYLEVGDGAGAVYVNVTKGDDFLFVALERAASILVVNMAKIRAGEFTSAAIVGRIPVGEAPIAVTLSNDGKYLYTTSQGAPPDWNWPLECRPEGQDPATAKPIHARGAIVVVDVARAQTDPMHSVVARAPVGCNPVRLAISPDGATAWVTARGDHSVVAVDTGKLLVDAEHSIVTRIRVGTAPVGVAIVDGGRRVIATNSNRFAGGADDRQSLNVVDVAGGAAHATLLGTVPAGAFPRELCVSPDGRTLFVSNFSSRTLEVLDLARLAPQKEP
jgi:DNA-binding beta-propeller fold protein YncE